MLNIDIAELMHTFLSGTGQNHPPTKTPLWPKPPSGKKKNLRQKPPSSQNPPPTKIPLWPKPPSDKKPLPKKKHLVNPPPLLV